MLNRGRDSGVNGGGPFYMYLDATSIDGKWSTQLKAEAVESLLKHGRLFKSNESCQCLTILSSVSTTPVAMQATEPSFQQQQQQQCLHKVDVCVDD